MDHFRRSVFRIFFMTFFLLFIAWIVAKVLQHGGDWQGLLNEAKGWFGGLGYKIEDAIQPAWESIRSQVEEMIHSAQEFLSSKIEPM